MACLVLSLHFWRDKAGDWHWQVSQVVHTRQLLHFLLDQSLNVLLLGGIYLVDVGQVSDQVCIGQLIKQAFGSKGYG